MLNVIVSNKEWHRKSVDYIKEWVDTDIVYIDDKRDLTCENLKKLNPRYIFFPHWSYIIPSSIYINFECVIFHMTDVPFGRGGSPLQNLVARGIYETKLTALKCEEELDAGPVYLKRPLSLHGTAEEIYLRSAQLTADMIIEIIKFQAKPIEQSGEIVNFNRRKPVESDIGELANLEKIFDYIRMLDADGYPHAYLETEHLRIEFERASLKHGYIKADVKIMLRNDTNEN